MQILGGGELELGGISPFPLYDPVECVSVWACTSGAGRDSLSNVVAPTGGSFFLKQVSIQLHRHHDLCPYLSLLVVWGLRTAAPPLLILPVCVVWVCVVGVCVILPIRVEIMIQCTSYIWLWMQQINVGGESWRLVSDRNLSKEYDCLKRGVCVCPLIYSYTKPNNNYT